MRVRNVGMVSLVLATMCMSNACGGADHAASMTGLLAVGTLAPGSSVQPGKSSRPVPPLGQPSTTIAITDDDIGAAFAVVVQRRIGCGRDPWSCDLDRIAIPGSPTYERLENLIESRRAAGIVTSGRGSFRFRIDKVEISSHTDESGSVEVSLCITDDTVLVDQNGWVFDDGLFSGHMVFTMREHDGEWLWFDDRTDTYLYGEDLCGLLA